MPLRKDLKSVLLIGSGPIVIGQACEFDYSGTQALKALREEGLRLILVNSNPATIMTDPELADRTYIEPMTVAAIAQIIEQERPDALLPTVGGQTALNLAIELAETGRARTLRRRADRREARRDQEGRGSRPLQARDDQDRPGSAGLRRRALARGGREDPRAPRLAADHPAVAHAGRHRRLDRARARRTSAPRCAGASRCRPITRC